MGPCSSIWMVLKEAFLVRQVLVVSSEIIPAEFFACFPLKWVPKMLFMQRFWLLLKQLSYVSRIRSSPTKSSLLVVSWVNGSNLDRSDIVQEVLHIQSNLAKLDQTSIIFMSRASNFLADSLAKSGSGGGADMVSWSFP